MNDLHTSSAMNRAELVFAVIFCVVLAILWTLPMDPTHSWGWDETMHAELPALRILFSLQEGSLSGAIDAVLSCSYYPFVYPVVLAASQGLFGAGEMVCRVTGTAVWCLTLLGLFLVGGEMRRVLAHRLSPTNAATLPWLALLFGALSPLALSYSGTLFLEVPAACAAVFTLRAWLRRKGDLPPALALKRHLAAGLWLTLCFFTKFNYGTMIFFSILLDWVMEGIGHTRDKTFKLYLKRSVQLFVIPLSCLSLWFFWPFAGPVDAGAVHRFAYLSYLNTNLGIEATPLSMRFLYLTCFFSPTARAFVVLLVGIVVSLRFIKHREVRLLWIVLLVFSLPMALHSFFLDRFLIPLGISIWILAAVGWAGLLPVACGAKRITFCAVVLGAGLWPSVDVGFMARHLGILKDNPQIAEYQLKEMKEWCKLSGSRRLASAGLRVEESQTFLDLIAAEVGPDERIGWIGMTPEVSPCGLLFGLYERGGTRARFLDQAVRPLFINKGPDPLWDEKTLTAFADGFDVILATSPVHMKGNRQRDSFGRYILKLVNSYGWKEKKLGDLEVQRPLQGPLNVTVFVLRKKK